MGERKYPLEAVTLMCRLATTCSFRTSLILLLCFGIIIASLIGLIRQFSGSFIREETMTSPDYITILKLDKIAMKSKTYSDFLQAVKGRLQYAKNLGVEGSFSFFVERAWGMFGDGK